MWLKKLPGIVVIVIGIGCLGHWVDRSFIRPTAVDKQFWHKVADFGGNPSIHGKPPVSLFFLLAIGSFTLGNHLLKK